MRKTGLTLVEVILGLAIASLVALSLARILGTSVQVSRQQRELSELEQNAAVVIHLLQNDLRLAGYRGSGQPAEFSGSANNPAARATALRWLTPRSESGVAINNWIAFRYSNSTLESIAVPSTSASANLGDEIRVRGIASIALNSASTAQFSFSDIGYRWDADNFELERQNSTLQSSLQNLSTGQSSAPAGNTLSETSNGGGFQPVADGVENFQIFFQQANGTWKRDDQRPAANLANTSPPPSTSLAAIGIYIRLRSPTPSGPGDCGPWPKDASRVLNASNNPVSWSSLNVTAITYSGSNCNYRRVEKVLTVVPATSAQYW